MQIPEPPSPGRLGDALKMCCMGCWKQALTVKVRGTPLRKTPFRAWGEGEKYLLSQLCPAMLVPWQSCLGSWHHSVLLTYHQYLQDPRFLSLPPPNLGTHAVLGAWITSVPCGEICPRGPSVHSYNGLSWAAPAQQRGFHSLELQLG